MSASPRLVLFLCTGNSARSVLAEAVMNHLGATRGFKAVSAGSHPKGSIHPMTLQVLAEHGHDTAGLHSKDWSVHAAPAGPALDFVFTVCDQAAGEACPVWPGQPITAHWGVPDPAAVIGDQTKQRQAFLEAYITLKRRIELMLALPVSSLDRYALQQHLRHIGTTP